MDKIILPIDAAFIIDELRKNGFEGHIVGGCVRDSIMGIKPHDYDITTSALSLIHIYEWAEAEATGLLYMLVDAGDDVKEGQKLAEICDMFGNVINEVYAKFDGHVLIIASTLAIKKGDDLITYGQS